MTVKDAARSRAILSLAQQADVAGSERKTAHMTKMLIFVSMAYLATSIPYRLFLMILLIPQVVEVFDFTETCDFLLYNVIIASLFIIWLFNFSLNFYMYCLGGGRKYRKDIKELFQRFAGAISVRN
jgi:hypothetical protein